jgi:D-arabinose 1-dehydrogenase-like Zn-dependent alcohol dehydrogenase
VPKAGGELEMMERELPEPRPGTVRVKVQACGICHSDSVTVEGLFPGIQYPRVPGHEVVGVVDKVGDGVKGWKVGDRVGVGWHGGQCGYCHNCRRGDFFACLNEHLTTGVTFDGGYAEYLVASASGLASVPEGLSVVDAAPLMCAGVTTFNCLRNTGARPGDLVAVLGLGGLGHLGVQYAAKMGFRTVAIARGADKAEFAKKMGAAAYIDSQAQDPSAELQKLGGAKIVLATVTNADAMTAVMGGLGAKGVFMIVGAVPKLEVPSLQMLLGSQEVRGWYSGTAADSEDGLNFSLLEEVRSINEIYKLEQFKEGYERMMSGKARFRVVMTME